MFLIVEKKRLNEVSTKMKIKAPMIAKKAKAGQFIILRVNEYGERIPLTISDCDKDEGTVTIVYQRIGKTTMLLDELNKGDYILDFVGPLGKPTLTDGAEKVVIIGGGVGCAIAFPQAKQLYRAGKKVDIIAGFRNKDLIILEDEMKKVCDNLFIMTDDGSNGNKGFVTNCLENQIKNGYTYDLAIAIGPLAMMKAVCELTKEHNIKTIVSMNPIMIDGTGMCGCCRVTVNGETKFACVDGPDFDGHKVDFDETMKRIKMYEEVERKKIRDYNCNLMKGVSDV